MNIAKIIDVTNIPKYHETAIFKNVICHKRNINDYDFCRNAISFLIK